MLLSSHNSRTHLTGDLETAKAGNYSALQGAGGAAVTDPRLGQIIPSPQSDATEQILTLGRRPATRLSVQGHPLLIPLRLLPVKQLVT